MTEIKLEITPSGGLAMLYDDAVDLRPFGCPEIFRASHVEADDNGDWYVESARHNNLLENGFKTRAEALAWEKKYYSPDGEGWKELV